MANLHDLYGTDASKETGGEWVDIGGAKFKIARAGGNNTRYLKDVQKRLKPYRTLIASDNMPPDQVLRLMRESYVETIVTDWASVDGSDGQPIPYSKEAALKIFEELPNLFNEIMNVAGSFAHFQAKTAEAVAGK